MSLKVIFSFCATAHPFRLKLHPAQRVVQCMMDSNVKEEMKKLLKEVIQEEKESQGKSGYPSSETKSSHSTTKPKKTQFDETRKTNGDPRDVRSQETTWPCMGAHTPKIGNNRYGMWKECSRCAYRMEYTPAVNAPGNTIKSDLPQNVQEALQRLRMEGWSKDDLEANTVKAMITLVSKEKQVKKVSVPKSKAKSKVAPRAKTSQPASHHIATDDEEDFGIEVVDDTPDIPEEPKRRA